MFDQLFVRSDGLTRQLSAPLAEERSQYLAQCAKEGMAAETLRMKARLLLSITKYLRLAGQHNDKIDVPRIERAAKKWSNHNWPSMETKYTKLSRAAFTTEATKWLKSMNRLESPRPRITVCDQIVAEFASFMKEERGLSAVTVSHCCDSARQFLDHVFAENRSLMAVTVGAVDSFLAQRVNKGNYARVSVRAYASWLRSFFRYAEMRRWCRPGIAASIMAPRVFQHETLPAGPSWDVVQEVLDATGGDNPTNVRDHAILMLLALYGIRSMEVARLRLSDIDWQQDAIVFTRSKGGVRHSFPLHPSVAAAIIRYLKEVRPKSPHRQVFLTRCAPIKPLSHGAIWAIVAYRLRKRAPLLNHHGPHSIRHACATHLINQGLSLKEIGDHLGHRDPEATRIYAKVDLVQLREVASFDLGELL